MTFASKRGRRKIPGPWRLVVTLRTTHAARSPQQWRMCPERPCTSRPETVHNENALQQQPLPVGQVGCIQGKNEIQRKPQHLFFLLTSRARQRPDLASYHTPRYLLRFPSSSSRAVPSSAASCAPPLPSLVAGSMRPLSSAAPSSSFSLPRSIEAHAAAPEDLCREVRATAAEPDSVKLSRS